MSALRPLIAGMSQGGGAGSGGATIADTTNLIAGDGAGNGVDSGSTPASFATAAQGTKADSALQAVAWGIITGSISSQSDLQAALNSLSTQMSLGGCWFMTNGPGNPPATNGAATYQGFGDSGTGGTIKLYQTDADGAQWNPLFGVVTPPVGSYLILRLPGSYGVYKITASSNDGSAMTVACNAGALVAGLTFLGMTDGTEVAISFAPAFIAPCPDGTVTPVTSITTINGIITAIS